MHTVAPHAATLTRSSLARLGAVVLAANLIAACTGPATGRPGGPASDLRVSLDSASRSFHQALRSNDTTTFFAHVAEDATLMPPGEASVRGKAGIRTWMVAFLAQYRTSSLTLADEEVFMGEGWATLLGGYEWGLTPVAGGASVIDRGHYMQVWQRSPDGTWRFTREIWNSSAAPTAPGAP